MKRMHWVTIFYDISLSDVQAPRRTVCLKVSWKSALKGPIGLERGDQPQEIRCKMESYLFACNFNDSSLYDASWWGTQLETDHKEEI